MARIAGCVFDAYGTLFDVAAAARAFSSDPAAPAGFDAAWPPLAETWRAKQLEYTWLRTLSGDYADFAHVTADALDFAMEKHGVDAGARGALLALYDRLGAYPEARAALETLRSEARRLAILSNGSPAMLSSAVSAAGFDALLEAVLSADAVRLFKPRPEVYALATAAFAAPAGDLCFVSSNGWDVCSAAAYGFRTVWVNRRGDPVDRLVKRPDHVVADLSALPQAVATLETSA